MTDDLYRIARESARRLTNEILPPVTLQIGQRYIQPEDRIVQYGPTVALRDTTYVDAVRRTLSYWKVEATGRV